tara:strand:- start:2906 stop:3154 length:249 start_codon:yes stop_codon:yes gene_type:complete
LGVIRAEELQKRLSLVSRGNAVALQRFQGYRKSRPRLKWEGFVARNAANVVNNNLLLKEGTWEPPVSLARLLQKCRLKKPEP